jgi:ribosomal protein S18 acetylase RimI-like enzyme
VLSRYLTDLRTFPADAALAWSQRGLAGVREELAHRTLYRVLRWGRMWVLEQDLSLLRAQQPPPGVTIEEFQGDWSELSEIATSREIRGFERAAAGGRVCLVARRGGRPIGYTWISFSIDASIETYQIPLPADAAYGWNLFVVPSERRSGTGTALTAARLALMRERGYARGWRMISPSNQASRRTYEKTSTAGSRQVATLSYVKIWRHLITRYVPSSEAPR